MQFIFHLMTGLFDLRCTDRQRSRMEADGRVQRSNNRCGRSGRSLTRPAALFTLIVAICLLPVALWAATPAGTDIDNIASATFNDSVTVSSNLARVTTVAPRTPSTIEFLQYVPAPTAATEQIQLNGTDLSTSGTEAGPFVPQPLPTPLGSAPPTSTLPPTDLAVSEVFHLGEPVFLRLTDLDQNTDTGVIETVIVTLTPADTGDREVLRLHETGLDTGVFVAYIPTTEKTNINPTTTDNGILSLQAGSSFTASYRDKVDSTDITATAALVDPYGIVFDSSTGTPIGDATTPGATITIIDVGTGLPATIFGDDGISSYPSTLVTGSGAIDSSGKNYSFPPGGYRYPFLAPGSYRFDITPPVGYAVPSSASTAQIQTLPGAPFAITLGSRGETFVVNPGPALHIDIPADPASTGLWLQKTAGKAKVATGDFIPYQVVVQNLDPVIIASNVVATDRLPVGFRYQGGSTTIDGVTAADPTIAGDGRTLTWNLGNLTAQATRTILYVAEVGSSVQPGEAINRVTATDDSGTTSNAATAAVMVREDLLRSKSFLAGRVLVGSCSEDDTALDGLAGGRIYLEDGSYVITDDEGKYHFEGVEPGIHVVQLDLDSLPPTYEVLACDENSRFAGRAYSQFVDLQGGTLWRADFHVGLKPKQRGDVSIELNSILESDGTVTYELPLQVGAVALEDLRLSVLLPEGLRYQPRSSRLDVAELPDPGSFGTTMTYRLGNRPANWKGLINFSAGILTATTRELSTRAILTFNSPEKDHQRTPMVDNLLLVNTTENREPLPTFVVRPQFPTFVAELNEEDRATLDVLVNRLSGYHIEKLYAIGHTDNVGISRRSRHIFPDNFALSDARANSVARYLGQRLSLAPEQIVIVGMADTMQIADNATAEGRAKNRRVEIQVEGYRATYHTSVELAKESSGPEKVTTVGLRPGEEPMPVPKSGNEPVKIPKFDETWFASAQPGLEWIWPPKDFSPAIPSLKVAIKHHPDQSVTFLHNGEEVNTLNFDGTASNRDRGIAVSRWRSIHLEEGDNTFVAIIRNPMGEEMGRMERAVHLSSLPVSVELLADESTPVADGKTIPVIAVRLLDKDGHPARPGLIGEVNIAPPYMARRTDKNGLNESLSDAAIPKYTIGPNGVAYISLEPTVHTGEATLKFNLISGEQKITSWLQPGMRDWILVGLAEGTVGYNLVHDHMETADAAGIDDDLYENNRVAFFAKGRIKGSWLLTLAYDSDKSNRKNRELQQTIDPDSYYTLYGDGTAQGYEAASSEKLFLKLERDQFQALFGDFETGLTTTELSRYSRSLTGVKAEMNSKRVEFKAFASDTGQSYVKDEIRGDGTSGLYRLSRRELVLNSEKVTIETRDRFRSERLLESRQLLRHVDYDIDYDDGTLFFKEPIASRDDSFNPTFIIVEYETNESRGEFLNFGGRAAVKFFDERLVVGGSYIREEQGLKKGDLTGIDAAVQISEHTRLRTELASSDNEEVGVNRNGRAMLAELKHDTEKLRASLYMREQEEDFGLGQQRGSESGTRKYGVEAGWQLNEKIGVEGEAFRQETLATGAERDLVEAKTHFKRQGYDAELGLRQATDRFTDGTRNDSLQFTSAASVRRLDERLTLRAQHDQTLDHSGQSADYPTRTTLGADYRLTERLSLFAAQEFTAGEDEDSEGTRAGFKATPWSGAKMNSDVERRLNENGTRVSANLGLTQKFQLTERWSLEASLDRSQTLRQPGSTPVNPNAAPASGSDNDFTAVSFGAAHKRQNWRWNGRAEWRTSDTDDKWTLASGLVVETRPGVAYSNRVRLHLTETRAGARATDAEIRFGMAWRPQQSRWIILDRLDLHIDRQSGVDLSFRNWRLVNNLNANFKPNRRTQIALQYGAKYVQETILGADYSGFTDLAGLESHYDLTKRWDVGLRGAVLHSWNGGQFDYSSGASVGYSMVKNVWLSLGYNLTGFRDEDFSAAGYTAQGPYLRFRMKFDQHSIRPALRWFTGS